MLFRVALGATSESLHPGEVMLMKKGNTEVTEPAVLFSKPCFPAFPSSFPQAELVPNLVFLEKLLAAHPGSALRDCSRLGTKPLHAPLHWSQDL